MESPKVEFLYLSEPDMIEAGVLDAGRCVEVMEETFGLLGRGDFLMGGAENSSHGAVLIYPETSEFPNMPLAGPDRRYMAMPAYLGGRFNVSGVKWYGSNRENIEKGLPRSVLMLSLNDAQTGEPLAVMSANLLSAMRTGSAPGVAAKYFARDSAEIMALVGCGVINRASARAILSNNPHIKRLFLCDIVPEQAAKLEKAIKTEYNVECFRTSSLRGSVQSADIVSVAASGDTGVYIEKEWIKPGCLLISSGEMGLPEKAYMESTVAFDHWPMHKLWLEEALEHKDGIDSGLAWGATSGAVLKLLNAGNLDESKFLTLGDVVAGKVEARRSDDEVIVFYSGGLPVEDVAWGMECYQRAKKLGLGHTDKVWDEPYWK